MVSDPEVLRERARRYRRKAADLRGRAEHVSPGIVEDLLSMATDYDEMAAQLDHIADSFG